MSSVETIITGSSNNQPGPSTPSSVSFPLILANNASVASLVNLLFQSGFYKFDSPEILKGVNRFIFSIPGIEKELLNPAFGKTKLYHSFKEQVFKKELPEKFSFRIIAQDSFKEISSESTSEIDIDALLAYCLHRNIIAPLLSNQSVEVFCDPEKLPQIDILDFFNVPKEHPEEKLELTFSRVHSILEEKFFQFRKPSSIDSSYLFIYMKSGLFLQMLRYCERNEISADGLMKGENVFMFNNKLYSRVSIEFFTENLIIPFCMDTGVSWEINNDDFI